MIKHLIALFALIVMVAPAHGAGVNLSRGQGLACEVILCAVGIAIPESHSECRRVLFDWSVYVATLGPFKRKPKCPMVDQNNVPTGAEQAASCSAINSAPERNACLAAQAPPRGVYDCGSYSDPAERDECNASCSVNAGGLCYVDVAPIDSGVYNCANFSDYADRSLCESSCTDTRAGPGGSTICYINVTPPPPGNYDCSVITDPADKALCEASCQSKFIDANGVEVCLIP